MTSNSTFDETQETLEIMETPNLPNYKPQSKQFLWACLSPQAWFFGTFHKDSMLCPVRQWRWQERQMTGASHKWMISNAWGCFGSMIFNENPWGKKDIPSFYIMLGFIILRWLFSTAPCYDFEWLWSTLYYTNTSAGPSVRINLAGRLATAQQMTQAKWPVLLGPNEGHVQAPNKIVSRLCVHLTSQLFYAVLLRGRWWPHKRPKKCQTLWHFHSSC